MLAQKRLPRPAFPIDPTTRLPAMVQTLWDYLTASNAQCIVQLPPTSTYTHHDEWAPVDAIQPWEDFSKALASRYCDSLAAESSLSSTVNAAEEAGHNIIFDETGLTVLIGSTNINMVSRALPGSLFLAAGSRIITIPGVRPDWGAGDTNHQYQAPKGVCEALVCGDTKLGWDVEKAMRMVVAGDYLEQRDAAVVRPFEQIQHYCIVYRTRYGFIITEGKLVLIRVRLSPPAPKQRPSSQPRIKLDQGHRRVLSDTSTTTTVSDISESFSTMSFRPRSQDEDVAALEVAIVPWDHGRSKQSINSALYVLVRLASEERGLSHYYKPIDVEAQPRLEKRKRPNESPEQSSRRGIWQPQA